MKHLILDHTPMDDYQRMIKQAYYTIESDEEYICKPDNNKEKLKNNKAYRYIAAAIKILVILAGIMVIGTVAIFLLMHKTGKSIVLRNLGIGSIIASARCREYAMTHPFVGYSAYDGVEHSVYYYTRDIHKKFEWPDKMMNADKLVSALRADRALKNNLKI